MTTGLGVRGNSTTSGQSSSDATGSAPGGGVSTGFGGLSDDGLPVVPLTIVLVGLTLAGSGLVLRKRSAA